MGADTSRSPEIARVLDPLSIAMAIRISSGRSTLEKTVTEFKSAVRLLLQG
jgi:hypothetical protein